MRADCLLLMLFAAAAVLLGCQEMFDTDVWWHLRAGQWILAHHRVPQLDPFTFASADRAWIDLHWGFQVALAVAHRLAGVRGMILLASAACAGAFLLALAARDKERSPFEVAAWCWVPALAVMSQRFDPRPESVSLLFAAAYLAILHRAERRPVLLWGLPVVQTLWVNTHALFVLGPILLGCYAVDRALAGPRRAPGWRVLAPVLVLVAAACLLNPYGLSGATFPLELLPKITDWGGPYKAHVAEFMSPRMQVQKQTVGMAAGNLYLRAFFFLALLLPISFVMPACWSRAQLRSWAWAGALGAAVGLCLLDTLGLPSFGTPRWLVALSEWTPALMLIPGLAASAYLARRDRAAGGLAAAATLAVASWTFWLRLHLFDPEGAPTWLAAATAGTGLAVAGLTLREGARPFRLLLALAFGFLGLQAVRNANLFGLVAGSVIAWNLAEWAGVLRAENRFPPAGPLRAALAALLAAWIVALPTGWFFDRTGEDRHFGLRERPFTYAHEAARFAGRPGMPDRALVFDLGQTGVYVFHDAPGRKPYMDARLEVPRRETFETYTRIDDWLNRGDPRWLPAVRRLGDPLILLDHAEESAAAATLMASPAWRCVYFDAVASVFLPRARPGLDASFPTVDFAARHFRGMPPPPRSAAEAYAEARALADVGAALRRHPETAWTSRVPILLAACDRARDVLDAEPRAGAAWTLMGHACWNMAADLGERPPGPADPWDPAAGLTWAQSAFCYRRALEQLPGNVPTRLALARSFELRGMGDARRAVEATLLRDLRRVPAASEPPPSVPKAAGAVAIEALLQSGRPQAAVRLGLDGRGAPLPWSLADRLGTAALHLGEPALARRFWESAADPPSPALRPARLADASLAALDLAPAIAGYRAALAIDPGRGDARYGLALALTQRGDAAGAAAACRESPAARTFTAAQRRGLEGLGAMAARFAPQLHAGRAP